MEIESLRMDNVKLYEKIKFLQNYRPNSGYQTNIDDEAGKKYASQYEGMWWNNLHPCSFNGNSLGSYFSSHIKINLTHLWNFQGTKNCENTRIWVRMIKLHSIWENLYSGLFSYHFLRAFLSLDPLVVISNVTIIENMKK